MSDLADILVSYLTKIKELEKRVESLEQNIASLQASLSKKDNKVNLNKLAELLSEAISKQSSEEKLSNSSSVEDLLDKAAYMAIKHYEVQPPVKKR